LTAAAAAAAAVAAAVAPRGGGNNSAWFIDSCSGDVAGRLCATPSHQS